MELLFWPVIISLSFLNALFEDKEKLKKEVEALEAVINFDSALQKFVEWKLHNPGVYIGLSDEGKAILTRLIALYDQVLRTCPGLVDGGFRDLLMNFFNDFPPDSPENMPVEERSHERFFFVEIRSQSC